jgi:hypothetical protein
MANPTTNYGFVLPTSSDLVTDLPADFDVALQGVDTRLKALQPGTTLGDLAYSSATANTNTRLGIGSTGQVLTVSGGVPTWAAASAGGMTLISTTTLSGSTTTITVGANSYKELQMVIRGLDCTVDNDVFFQINGITTSTYTPASIGSSNGVAYTRYAKTNGVYLNLVGSDGCGTGNKNNGTVIFFDPNSTNGKVINSNFFTDSSTASLLTLNSTVGVTDTAVISSIVFKQASGSFDAGTVLLYGVS